MNQEELLDYKLKGYCCSQIIMQACLTRMEEDNPELIKAMGGLCMGSQIGSLCGALSGVICAMSMMVKNGNTGSMTQDIADWFEDAYGSLLCSEITGDDPTFKMQQCAILIENTFTQMEEILEMNGKLPW